MTTPPPGPPSGPPYGPPPGPGGPYGWADPAAPWGRDPMTGEPYGEKQKVLVGVLNILIPGVGRMYMGDVTTGVIQLVVAIITCGIGALWSLIDGIVILTTRQVRDPDGRLLRA